MWALTKTYRFNLAVRWFVVYAGLLVATLVVAGLLGQRELQRQFDATRAEVAAAGQQTAPALDPGLAAMRRSLRQFTRRLVTVGAIGLVLAAAAAWWLAGHALSPVGRIARDARRLSLASHGQRLPVPPGEDELTDLVDTLNHMLERLEWAFEAQERFVANAAHELKTPVAAVLGEAQVLAQKDRSTAEYDRFIANVADEMKRLGQIVHSMLILTRADAGLPLAASEAVDINEVVTEVVARCQSQADRQGVRLVPVLALPDGDQPYPVVEGDAELLCAAVANLLRNAIRFSPPDEPVEVQVKLEPERVAIAVRDHGPGIPDEVREQLFDRFYSVPASASGGKGVGLGLAIARGVADLHHGAIHACQHPDGGAEFTIELPLAGSPDNASR